MNKPPTMFDRFVNGIEFYRHPGPPVEELRRDLELLHSRGFDTIRLQSVWSWEEPEPGQYDFDKLATITEDAAALGFAVILTFTLDCVPTWLWQDHDIAAVNAWGEKLICHSGSVLPGDGKPGPCWDNPVLRDAADRYVAAFMNLFGGYPCIQGWSVWQEAGFWAGFCRGGEAQRGPGANLYCFCPHSLDRFRDWLRDRYGTLDALNEACLTNYRTWERVEPPRSSRMLPLSLDHGRWWLDRSGDIAAWFGSLVKRHDPLQRPVMCHTSPDLTSAGALAHAADEERLARGMDGFGKSLYPGWSAANGSPADRFHHLLWRLDPGRGAAAGKPFWAAELQAGQAVGQGGLVRYPRPTPRELLNWNLATLAGGVDGIVHWAWREEVLLEEAYGFGLLDRRGQPLPWLDTAANFDAFLKRHEPLLHRAHLVESPVAILIDPDAYLLADVTGAGFAVEAARSVAHALYALNLTPRIVWKSHFLDHGLESRLLILPSPLVASPEYAQALTTYVSAGGSVLSFGGLGLYTELGTATPDSPPYGLDSLFGGRQLAFHSQPDGTLTGEGLDHPAHRFVHTFEPDGADVWLRWNGEPAGLSHRYGEGRASWVGTLPGEPLALLRAFLAGDGIHGEATPCLVRRLQAPEGELVIAFNPGSGPVTAELEAGWGRLVECIGAPARLDADGRLFIQLPPETAACAVLMAEDRS